MREITLEDIENMSWPPPTRKYTKDEFLAAALYSQRKAVSSWTTPFFYFYHDIRIFVDDVGPFLYYEVRHAVSRMILAYWFVPKGALLEDIVKGGPGESGSGLEPTVCDTD